MAVVNEQGEALQFAKQDACRGFARSVSRHIKKRTGIFMRWVADKFGEGIQCGPGVGFCLGADMRFAYMSETACRDTFKVVLETLEEWGVPHKVAEEPYEQQDKGELDGWWFARIHVESKKEGYWRCDGLTFPS